MLQPKLLRFLTQQYCTGKCFRLKRLKTGAGNENFLYRRDIDNSTMCFGNSATKRKCHHEYKDKAASNNDLD